MCKLMGGIFLLFISSYILSKNYVSPDCAAILNYISLAVMWFGADEVRRDRDKNEDKNEDK